MKSNYLIAFILIFLPFNLLGQSAYEGWDQKYHLVELSKVIQQEENYQSKVEADTTEAQWYLGLNSYRFVASYTGNFRDISEEKLESMERVMKVKTGNSAVIRQLLKKEVEFKIQDQSVWMPIQDALIPDLKKESDRDKELLIYALLCTEHTETGNLWLSFLISEFAVNWN